MPVCKPEKKENNLKTRNLQIIQQLKGIDLLYIKLTTAAFHMCEITVICLQNRTAAAMSAAMYKLYRTKYEFGPAAETLSK